MACNNRRCGCEPAPQTAEVYLHYTDNLGHDLFDSSTTYTLKDIKIYAKQHGVYTSDYLKNMDDKTQFLSFIDTNHQRLLRVFPYTDNNETISEMLVELRPGVSDTLKCLLEFNSAGSVFKKAWINGVETNNNIITIKK